MDQKTPCLRIRVQTGPVCQRCRWNLVIAALSAVLLIMYLLAFFEEPVKVSEISQRPKTMPVPEALLQFSTGTGDNTSEIPSLEEFFESHSLVRGTQDYDFSRSSWYDNRTVFSYDYGDYIKPQQSFSNLRYLFVVTTAVKYIERRRMVRDTWRNHLERNNDSKLVFLVGDPVDYELQRQALKEAWKHDDIVQFSFTEHYENMTLKSIMMLKWAEQWQPTFLVKIDDDVMVNIKLFRGTIEILNSRLPEFIAGYGIFGKVPSRDRYSKWFVPWSEYAQSLFPDYVAGMLYAFPGNLIPAFYAAALNTKPVRFEDVYVAGLLAEKLNVTRIGLPNMDIDGTASPCDMWDILATHTKPERMAKFYGVLEGHMTDCGKS